MPTIGYEAIPTIGAANPKPTLYGAKVTPGAQTTYTAPTVANINAIRANARPEDFHERAMNHGPSPDTFGDGGY